MMKSLLLENDETVSPKLPLHPEGLLSIRTDCSEPNNVPQRKQETDNISIVCTKERSIHINEKEEIDLQISSLSHSMINDSFQQEIIDIDMVDKPEIIETEHRKVLPALESSSFILETNTSISEHSISNEDEDSSVSSSTEDSCSSSSSSSSGMESSSSSSSSDGSDDEEIS